MWPNLFLEDAEDGGTAAGHRGVEGAAAIHVIFEGGDSGMRREDGGLEVVDDEVVPLPYRLLDRFAQVGTCGSEEVALEARISLFGRHMFPFRYLNLN